MTPNVNWKEVLTSVREQLNEASPINFYKLKDLKKEVIKSYEPIVEKHLKVYGDELTQFFEKTKKPLIGFDVEELFDHRAKKNEVFCIMGLKINPSLSFRISAILPYAYPNAKQTKRNFDNFLGWLQKHQKLDVITHGNNVQENTLIKNADLIARNTQDYLQYVISKKLDDEIGGIGLKHFEEKITFQRYACDYLKHDVQLSRWKFINLFYDICKLSVHNFISGKPQTICPDCGKPQDVFLYCLEDAISSILIYVYYSNRGVNIKEKSD